MNKFYSDFEKFFKKWMSELILYFKRNKKNNL